MKGWTAGIFAILIVAGEARGQRSEQARALPSYIAPRVRQIFDDPRTLRYEGDTEIRRREVIDRDVAVLDGRLSLAGEVRGDVVVINGDLLLDSFARVIGDVIVLGGAVRGSDRSVEGRLTVDEGRVRYSRRNGEIRFQERRRGYSGPGPRPRSRLSVRVEGSYNRVEGLPVMFGPVIQSGGWNHVRIDGLAIWRSAQGFQFEPEDLGYFVRAEQHLGEGVQLILGGTAHSMTVPVERWGLTEIESSVSTALLHQDYRDYFEREGFSGFLRLAVPEDGFEASIEYRDEDHVFQPVADPWTWKNQGRAWRPQSLIAAGKARTVTGYIEIDDRNDPRDPSDGWYVLARGTRGVGGSLTVPEYATPVSVPGAVVQPARGVSTEFMDGLFDLRRYYRVGPSADLRFRGLLAGSLDESPLPPQFQHALGGLGSLPGHVPFAGDCGARAQPYSVTVDDGTTTFREPAFASYGCDRIALFQAEYRGGLSFDFGDGGSDEWAWSPSFDFFPSWSVFFDAGRGWTLSEAGQASYLGPDTAELMDAGLGLYFGDVGIFWAWPLRGGGEGATFFMRLDHRF